MVIKRKYAKKAKVGELRNASLYRPLPKAQAEVLYMITVQFLTPAQVSKQRKTTLRATQMIIQKLRQTGVLNKANELPKNRGRVGRSDAPNFGEKTHSLHGLQWRVNVLKSHPNYDKVLNLANQMELDGCTLKLFKDRIIVHCHEEFNHDKVSGAVGLSLDWLERILRSAEHRLSIVLVKAGYLNIKQVAGHFGFPGDPVAVDVNRFNEKLHIKADEDGKLAVLVDASGGLDEIEFVHPKTGRRDAEEIWQPTLNDWRNGTVPLPGEMWRMMAAMTQVQSETVAGLATVIKLLQPQKMTDNIPGASLRPDYIG